MALQPGNRKVLHGARPARRVLGLPEEPWGHLWPCAQAAVPEESDFAQRKVPDKERHGLRGSLPPGPKAGAFLPPIPPAAVAETGAVQGASPCRPSGHKAWDSCSDCPVGHGFKSPLLQGRSPGELGPAPVSQLSLPHRVVAQVKGGGGRGGSSALSEEAVWRRVLGAQGRCTRGRDLKSQASDPTLQHSLAPPPLLCTKRDEQQFLR